MIAPQGTWTRQSHRWRNADWTMPCANVDPLPSAARPEQNRRIGQTMVSRRLRQRHWRQKGDQPVSRPSACPLARSARIEDACADITTRKAIEFGHFWGFRSVDVSSRSGRSGGLVERWGDSMEAAAGSSGWWISDRLLHRGIVSRHWIEPTILDAHEIVAMITPTTVTPVSTSTGRSGQGWKDGGRIVSCVEGAHHQVCAFTGGIVHHDDQPNGWQSMRLAVGALDWADHRTLAHIVSLHHFQAISERWVLKADASAGGNAMADRSLACLRSTRQAALLQPVRQQLRKCRRRVVLSNGWNPCGEGLYSALHKNAHQDVRISIASNRHPDRVG
jgi:hypothetical protein